MRKRDEARKESLPRGREDREFIVPKGTLLKTEVSLKGKAGTEWAFS